MVIGTLVGNTAQISKFGKKPSCVPMEVKSTIPIKKQLKNEETGFSLRNML